MTDHNLPHVSICTKSARVIPSTAQAIIIARAACSTLRHGQPAACTYDCADLDRAINVLGQMLAAIELQGDEHGR